MKLEALILRSLCAVGMLVSALVLGAMLTATPAAGNGSAASTARVTLAACPQTATAAVLPPARS